MTSNTKTYLRVIAITIGISSIPGFLVTALTLSSLDESQFQFLGVGFFILTLNVIFCVSAYGLWHMQPWSWWLAASWCAYTVIRIGAESYFAGTIPVGINIFWLVVVGTSLVFLFRREMGEIFNIRLARTLSASLVLVIGGLLAAFPYLLRASAKGLN